MASDEYTNDDVKWALSELMDGVKEHDLPGMTSLSQLQCARLFRIAQFAMTTRDNFVIGESVHFDGCDDIGRIDRIVKDCVYVRCNGHLYCRVFNDVYPCNE